MNRSPITQAPYVGETAFATKAGIHASAIIKDPRTYEHIDPVLVGNKRKLLVSDQGGKSNIISVLKRLKIDVKNNDPRILKLLEIVKEREANGYTYASAEASFELLARRLM